MTIPTEQEYQNALEVTAQYERIQQELLAQKRGAYFSALSSIVAGADFSNLKNALMEVQAANEAEGFFSLYVSGVISTLGYLDDAVSHYSPPVGAPQTDPEGDPSVGN
jgi:hypothetical protein